MKKVSVVIPAYNEEASIGSTLRAIRERILCQELIVVDDGSVDDTAQLARQWADLVISTPQNRGKGAALQQGWQHASGDVVMLLDGDLRESAAEAAHLLSPVVAGTCDMSVAVLPPPPKSRPGLGKGLGSSWDTHTYRL